MKQNNCTDPKYFKYTILNNGTIEITGNKEDIPSHIIIPKEIDNKTVTSVGSKAFLNNKLRSVVIPNTIKK